MLKTNGDLNTATLDCPLDRADLPAEVGFKLSADQLRTLEQSGAYQAASAERRPQMWEKILSTGHVWYARASNWDAWWAPLTKTHKKMLPIAFAAVFAILVVSGTVFTYTANKIKESVENKEETKLAQDTSVQYFRVVDRVRLPDMPAVAQATDYVDLRSAVIQSLNSTGKLPDAPGLSPWPANNILNPQSAAWLAAGADTYFIAVLLKDDSQNDRIWFGAAHKMKEVKPGMNRGEWEMVNVTTLDSNASHFLLDRSLRTVSDRAIQLALNQSFANVAR